MASTSTPRRNLCFHEDDIDNEILIDEIELRLLLYDKSLKDYSNSNLKAKAWEEVCIKVFFNIWGNLSTQEKTEAEKVVQKRWKNIRACFSRELREQKSTKTGQADKKRKTYRYYENFYFSSRVWKREMVRETLCLMLIKTMKINQRKKMKHQI
ncbi:uncharacterized protein LOC123663019 [Melitaea cinxia]|uniref:uncharacterized protein LOC123663019 n=1 Tax=Melitaea cinxia TaxID=113334 RepID=UPI001E273A44|nr:uncharacterized protein LOC123663019 [Melitaea cinxia]